MKNLHPLKSARRRAQRLEKLLVKAGDSPICVFCGCSEPMLLRPVLKDFYEKHRHIFERHHVFGRCLDVHTTLSLCLNCHALITEGFLQAGVEMKREPNPIRFAAMIFRAMAVHFRMLSDACWKFAKFMAEHQEGI